VLRVGKAGSEPGRKKDIYEGAPRHGGRRFVRRGSAKPVQNYEKKDTYEIAGASGGQRAQTSPHLATSSRKKKDIYERRRPRMRPLHVSRVGKPGSEL
jgi:hypothetical protein